MKTWLFALFVVLFFGNIFGQNYSPRYVKIKYYYVIEKVNSESQLNELKSNFLQINGVDEVKFEYKPEKQRARAIILTTQKIRQSEADDEFKITALKQAILNHNMIPLELSEEVVEQ